MLNLVHLKVLAAVARHGSVTAAAKELRYSQPSVSHHLSRLEAATGAKLVQRVGRGIRLTPEGQLLASRATEIVGRVDAATNELAAQVGLQAGRVRLAAVAGCVESWLGSPQPRSGQRRERLEQRRAELDTSCRYSAIPPKGLRHTLRPLSSESRQRTRPR
jgi:molybdate transport repressor ModE-like protein